MQQFPLIRQLSQPDEPKSKLPSGIKYQKYEVSTQSGNETVYIPLRECSNFEQEVEQHNPLYKTSLKQILRKYRGIVE